MTRRIANVRMFAFLFLSSVSVSFAQDAQVSIVSVAETRLWTAKGFSVVSAAQDGSRTSYVVKSAGGRTVRVESSLPMDAARIASLDRLNDATEGWKSMTADEITAVVDRDSVRVRIMPSRFEDGGKDFTRFVPSGLVFVAIGDRTEYDFRVKVEAYFIRFQGVLQSEASFVERLMKAVSDPANYIRDNDPDFLIRRVTELQMDSDRAAADIAVLKTRAAEIELRDAEQERLFAEYVAATDSRIKELVAAAEQRLADQAAASDKRFAELAAATEARFAEQTALSDKNLAALTAAEEKTAAAEEKTAAAAMAALSKGLFGAPKRIDPAAVARVVALRRDKPDATAADLSAALKAEGVVISDKQIKAVLSVLFGEY